jgi:hypothetical protein
MTEEEQTKQAPVQENKPQETPKGEDVEFSLDEIKKLEQEIEDAKKRMVTEDIEKKIAAEREAAKKEAEKEFLVNQRVKELEKEKEELRKKSEEVQLENARQLDALKEQMNKLISSKAVASGENPFRSQQKVEPEVDFKTKIDQLTNEEVAEIERLSAEAFFENKSRV